MMGLSLKMKKRVSRVEKFLKKMKKEKIFFIDVYKNLGDLNESNYSKLWDGH